MGYEPASFQVTRLDDRTDGWLTTNREISRISNVYGSIATNIML